MRMMYGMPNPERRFEPDAKTMREWAAMGEELRKSIAERQLAEAVRTDNERQRCRLIAAICKAGT